MIDLATARTALKIDEGVIVEDTLLQKWITAALLTCESFCNRKFYVDADARATDFADAVEEWGELAAAQIADLADIEDCSLASAINDRYIQDFGALKQRMNGIVADELVDAAQLMLIGHFYENRSEDLAASVNVNTMPTGAKRILQPYLWIGDLA